MRQYKTEINIQMWDETAHAPGAGPDLTVTLHTTTPECEDPRDLLTVRALEVALEQVKQAARYA
jgi:hypothetical protein